MSPERFDLQYVALRLMQALNLIRASISISRSRISCLVIFRFGPVRKIWLAFGTELSAGGNRTGEILHFFGELKKKFPISRHLHWNLGLEGSGILVRILELQNTPGMPLENMILWEIKRNLPFAVTASHFSWRVLSRKDETIRVIVAILKKDFLDGLLDLLQKSGITADTITLNSLNLAARGAGRDYVIIFQGSDYGFFALVDGQKLRLFQISHENREDRSWDQLQRQWQRTLELTPEFREYTVYRFSSDPHLPWTSGSSPRELTAGTQLPALSESLTPAARHELTCLHKGVSFSPDLLPDMIRKKRSRENLLWKAAAFFAILQLITPAIYTSIRRSADNLWSNTSFSRLPYDIQKTREKLTEIDEAKKEIAMYITLARQSSHPISPMLQKIAQMSRPNMTLSRVKAGSGNLMIEGLSLDVGTVSEFMADLEQDLEEGELSMSSERKGDAISFAIRWKKSKTRHVAREQQPDRNENPPKNGRENSPGGDR